MKKPAKRKPAADRDAGLPTLNDLHGIWAEKPTAPSSAFPPLPERAKILVTVFTYANNIGRGVFRYCCKTIPQMQDHPRVECLAVGDANGYPTDRVRNAAAKQAADQGYHFLLMLDDDMTPDIMLGHDDAARPFLPTALDFAYSQPGPAIIGAPYTGGPPRQRVMVMRDRDLQPDAPPGWGKKLDSYTREEAAGMTGFGRVSALPTGCLLIDLRALAVLPPPWFSYEYDDPPFNTRLASTEDIVFTRNLHWLGVPQFSAWDSWAGHDKFYTTSKPQPCPVEEVPTSILKAWESGWRPAGWKPAAGWKPGG